MAEILVVEDFPPMASLLTMMLRRCGHSVERELTVAGALRNNRVFQHAVLDIDLPDGSGVLLGQQLLDEQRVTRVVFFSATREEKILSHAASLGVVVSKSDGPGRLLDAIQRLEENSALPRILRADPATVPIERWPSFKSICNVARRSNS